MKGTTQHNTKQASTKQPNKQTDKQNNMSIEVYRELATCLKRYPKPCIEELNVLIENYPEKDLQEAVLHTDFIGCLLIHHACFHDAPVEVTQLLLDSEAENKSIFQQNRMGWLPIHAACYGPSNLDTLRLLLDRDTEKKTLLVKDIEGRLPIYTACEEGRSVEVIHLLLQASTCDRIKRLQIERNRLSVQELIKDMTQEDSTWTRKVQAIYERLAKYEMEHTMSLLALAVWRTSCLHWGDLKFVSMQEMEMLAARDGAFDPAGYRLERRIKSGVDMIIRGVQPFVPVDEHAPPNPSFRGALLNIPPTVLYRYD